MVDLPKIDDDLDAKKLMPSLLVFHASVVEYATPFCVLLMAFVAKQPSAAPIAILSLLVSKSQNLPDTFGLYPNVQGSFELSTAASNAWIRSNGALKASLGGNKMPEAVIGQGDVSVSFNASNSSGIYKNISKIRVRSAYILIIIKS